MRMVVGVIATALPFALAVGNMVFGLLGPAGVLPHPIFQPSISAYYYTDLRNVLVGSLCAIAVFNICSVGYDLQDKIAGQLSGVFALGVAFFPTTNPAENDPSPMEQHIGTVHLIFASLMFLTLAYFCLVLFTRTAPGRTPTPRKRQRNIVYLVCGWTIVGSIVVMVSLNIAAIKTLLQCIDPLFCFETVSIIAFGVAWLTKGKAILRDL
jgi:hypothetical protein